MSGLCGGCCRRKGRGDAAYACGAHPKRLTYAEKCARADAPPPPPVVVVEEAKPAIRTTARALLLGMGADELLAGYARHRTAFKRGGLEELEREVGVDVSRIATRNLGRDDRVTAAWAREARYPFLDEDVVRCVRVDLGSSVADLALPPGDGCKRAPSAAYADELVKDECEATLTKGRRQYLDVFSDGAIPPLLEAAGILGLPENVSQGSLFDRPATRLFVQGPPASVGRASPVSTIDG